MTFEGAANGASTLRVRLQQIHAANPCEGLGLAEPAGETSRQDDDPHCRQTEANHCYHVRMTRNYVSLQRRPFLTPIWLTALGAVLAVGFIGFSIWVWATAGSTTIVVIRHAEKIADGGADPAASASWRGASGVAASMFGSERESWPHRRHLRVADSAQSDDRRAAGHAAGSDALCVRRQTIRERCPASSTGARRRRGSWWWDIAIPCRTSSQR